jgi:hypothetical protein
MKCSAPLSADKPANIKQRRRKKKKKEEKPQRMEEQKKEAPTALAP